MSEALKNSHTYLKIPNLQNLTKISHMSSKYVSKVKMELMLLEENLQPQFTKPAQFLTPIYKYLSVCPRGSVVSPLIK